MHPTFLPSLVKFCHLHIAVFDLTVTVCNIIPGICLSLFLQNACIYISFATSVSNIMLKFPQQYKTA